MTSEAPDFNRRIPRLVTDIISGSESFSKRAKQGLLLGIAESESYDPVLIAIAEIQRELIRGGRPKILKRGIELIEDVLAQGEMVRRERESISINAVDPLTREALSAIAPNHARMLRQSPYGSTVMRSFLPDTYLEFAERHVPMLMDAVEQDVEKLYILHSGSKDESAKVLQQSANLIQWQKECNPLINSDYIYTDPIARDRFVDLLRVEPEIEVKGFRKPRIFDEAVYGITLTDIEGFSTPLSTDDYLSISLYLIGSFSQHGSTAEERDLLTNKRRSLSLLFGLPTLLHGHFESFDIKNKKLFSVINEWLELCAAMMLIPTKQDDKIVKEPMKELLTVAPDLFRISMLAFSIPAFIYRPHIYKASFNYSDPYAILSSILPAEALNVFENQIPTDQGFFQSEDLPLRYLHEIAIPKLRETLSEFGLPQLGRFIDILEQNNTPEIVRAHRAKEIKDSFDYLAGETFVAKLKDNPKQLKEQTEIAWDSIFEGKGMHYLPLADGINRVTFSIGSTPEIIGLAGIDMMRVGTPQDWAISVRFNLKRGGSVIVGTLDRDGKFTTEQEIEDQVPGLSLLLNDIAILVFKDLVIQREVEESLGKKHSKDKNKGLNGHIVSSSEQLGVLPREQSDEHLMAVVSKFKTGRPPRKVEIHKANLRGRKEYLEAVKTYQQAMFSGSPEEQQRSLFELEKARAASFNASKEKVATVPVRFKLEEIEDPVTKEVRYVQTWVIEHTNPKPTPEELASLTKLYIKYYKGASSLAFLDQLKPWFVGA